MASTEAATATLSVDEIAAMSDADLGQFMKKYRRSEGSYELPVDGWDKLSKDDRNRLAERLKAHERSLAQSPTAFSPPLDLDDLDARLRQVSPDNSFSLRLNPQTTERSEPSTPPFDPEVERTRYEIESYHELIDDGGRPLYPIDLITDIFRNTDKYADILRPWQESLTQIRPERIFKRQLRRWQDFRKWQNDNRGREDDDGGFPAYVEWRKYMIKRGYRREVGARRLAEIEADPLCLKPRWEDKQWERERQRRRYRDYGCDGFHDYTEAAVQRAESEAKRTYLLTQDDPQRLRIPKEKRISMLRAGSAKLLAAKGQFEQVRSRNHQITTFIRGTFDYGGAKRDAARHRILVQWVLEQVPLIEVEMAQPKAKKADSDHTKRMKRRLTTDAESLGRRKPKRPKLDQELEPFTSSGVEAPSKARAT
ncbi:hypothetical protein TOPH_02412 [Tolypocladium ophioglossoides CBS 100239]|uniref:Uncharacterized protein n=1 Tax=Tolypocladium ophioglossoides (strain CBS 100239) TaxID=1163406 RepID=A0A0L0NGH1_TOLOC|nr:hypothetical protein TOPH_02412 [Tolypocladium ophioglossoides CBS 100239]